MTEKQPDYRSFLLRLWRQGPEPCAWRASLESTATGERRAFASLESLFAFLGAEVAAQGGDDNGHRSPGGQGASGKATAEGGQRP